MIAFGIALTDVDQFEECAAPGIEWPTVLLIVATYAGWAAVAWFIWPLYPALALVLLGFLLAMQSSLMHEASHGHPTRKLWLNELLVGLPIGLVYPFRRFRALHLRHHADESLTDPFDDPESYYRAFWQHEDLPPLLKTLLRANNTMVGRFVLGPLLEENFRRAMIVSRGHSSSTSVSDAILPTLLAIFSPESSSISLCIQILANGRPRAPSLWVISFSWCGNVRSSPPP